VGHQLGRHAIESAALVRDRHDRTEHARHRNDEKRHDDDVRKPSRDDLRRNDARSRYGPIDCSRVSAQARLRDAGHASKASHICSLAMQADAGEMFHSCDETVCHLSHVSG